MSLDSYTNLKDELVSWLRRSDFTTSDSRLDTAISLFEASAKRDLRCEELVLQGLLTTDTGYETLDLPADFKQFSSMRLSTDPRPLKFVSREYLNTSFQASQMDRPKAYATGPYNQNSNRQTVQFGPVPDNIYNVDLFYNAVFTGLSATNASNWLLTYAPDLYLYGCLKALLVYVDDATRGQTIMNEYNTAMASIDEDQSRKRAAGAAMMPTAQGNTP